jgi:hypothetical protein
LIHHPRKRPPKAKSALEMKKSERLEEIRGSAARSRRGDTLGDRARRPSSRRVVNHVPPRAGDKCVRWELAGPPTNAEAERIRDRLLSLEPGEYNFTALARHVFNLGAKSKPSGQRRTQAKEWPQRLAQQEPGRFRVFDRALEVLCREA